MPAVMASGLFNICYAGEPAIPNWNGPNTGIQYNENNNYIFLNKQTPNGITTMPMEAGASVSAFDSNYEGRAPTFPPTAQRSSSSPVVRAAATFTRSTCSA